MDKIEKDIISVLIRNSGLSDREVAEAIKGHGASSKSVNQNCRSLESQGILWRYKRDDGLIGNWLIENSHTRKILLQYDIESRNKDVSEKKLKIILSNYLTDRGWLPKIFWGVNHGIDIEARLGHNRWIIQVKGAGLFHPIVINNFLLVLGEIFQRMDDANGKYSIALPDQDQFHRLWERLPKVAKSRLGITALFVHPEGRVVEEF